MVVCRLKVMVGVLNSRLLFISGSWCLFVEVVCIRCCVYWMVMNRYSVKWVSRKVFVF